MDKLIHILGHNEIILKLTQTLISKNIPFRVYSNQEIEGLNSNFIMVNDLLSLKELLTSDMSNSLYISAGAPWIMDKSFLESFEPHGIFNIHGTALPSDRGGTIVSWLIMNKKRLGNAIIHKMVSKPDAGPILLSEEFIYPIECQYPQDYLKYYNMQQEKLATKFCLMWVNQEIDLLQTAEQPQYLSTYWPRLNAILNAWIDWNWPGEEIELFIRAFDDPYKGALTTWRGKTVFLKKCFFQRDQNFHPYQIGIVYRIRLTSTVKYIAIAVNGGTLYCEYCVDELSSSMFEHIKEGDRLQTSNDNLINSQKRTVKTQTGFAIQKNLQ